MGGGHEEGGLDQSHDLGGREGEALTSAMMEVGRGDVSSCSMRGYEGIASRILEESIIPYTKIVCHASSKYVDARMCTFELMCSSVFRLEKWKSGKVAVMRIVMTKWTTAVNTKNKIMEICEPGHMHSNNLCGHEYHEW